MTGICSWAARTAGRKARTARQEKRRVPFGRLNVMSLPPSKYRISLPDRKRNLVASFVDDEQAAENGEGGRWVRRFDRRDELSAAYRDPVMVDHEVVERIRIEVGNPVRIPAGQRNLYSPSAGRLDEPGFVCRETGRVRGFWIAGREKGENRPGFLEIRRGNTGEVHLGRRFSGDAAFAPHGRAAAAIALPEQARRRPG